MKRKMIAAGLLVLGMSMGAPADAVAQGPGPGAGYGPGMMQGYGYGPGAGYGPGMMQGYGNGPGGGRGPGWGGGPGWERGGYGPGGGLAGLNLTEEQQEKIATIQEENRRKNWETMGQVRSEQFKLRQMAFSDKVDPNAVADQQKKVDDLRRNMLKSRVEARNQVDAILTPEQRKLHRQIGPWWLQEGGSE